MNLKRAVGYGLFFSSLFTLVVGSSGCTDEKVGSSSRPFTMYFVPSVDAQTVTRSADQLTHFVSEYVSKKISGGKEKFHIKSAVPSSYIAVVEALGTGRADFAALTTFSYILTKDIKKYDVEALVRVVRGDNENSYKAQIIARVDSGIKTLQDLNGKKFAFTDPASTAGYILPKHLMESQGILPGQTVFAQKHDNVVTMVYQGQVDAGATYYSPPRHVEKDGKQVEEIMDARAKVKTQFPDVESKVKIVTLTEDTPNEPWVVRSHLGKDNEYSNQVKAAVKEALLQFASTEEGKKALFELYSITGLADVDDHLYEGIRKLVLASNVNIEETLNPTKKQ